MCSTQQCNINNLLKIESLSKLHPLQKKKKKEKNNNNEKKKKTNNSKHNPHYKLPFETADEHPVALNVLSIGPFADYSITKCGALLE